jgi:long-chain acyl-CoA synthetase
MPITSVMGAALWRAGREGSRPCVRFLRGGAVQTLSRDEVAEQLTALLVGLDNLRLPGGARIGVLSPNRWEWILIDVAAGGAGLAAVAVDPLWSDDHLVRVLEHARVQGLFVETVEDARRLQRLRGRLPSLAHLIVIEADRSDANRESPGIPTLSDLLEAGRGRKAAGSVSARVQAGDLDAPAAVIFTGGSTGTPKGVIWTHGNELSLGGAAFPWMGDQDRPEPAPDDVLLDPLSFCHSAGRWGAQMALVRGATLALPPPGPLSLPDVQRLAPTHMLAVPRVVLALQKLLPAGASADYVRAALGGQLRCIVSGGAALSSESQAFFEAAGIEMRVAYGSTEVGVLAMHRASAGRGLGRPIGAEVRIVDGEVLVRGPAVTPGYLDDPQSTAAARADGGWWRTGDAGALDRDGCLTITGRIRAMFNCSEGTNIDPQVIEHLLESDPHILQAVIVGHRRPYLAALLVPDEAALARARVEDVEAFLRERLGRLNQGLEAFEKVRRIQVVDPARMAEVRTVGSAQKIRIDRAAVDQVFAAEIERLYDPAACG